MALRHRVDDFLFSRDVDFEREPGDFGGNATSRFEVTIGDVHSCTRVVQSPAQGPANTMCAAGDHGYRVADALQNRKGAVAASNKKRGEKYKWKKE